MSLYEVRRTVEQSRDVAGTGLGYPGQSASGRGRGGLGETEAVSLVFYERWEPWGAARPEEAWGTGGQQSPQGQQLKLVGFVCGQRSWEGRRKRTEWGSLTARLTSGTVWVPLLGLVGPCQEAVTVSAGAHQRPKTGQNPSGLGGAGYCTVEAEPSGPPRLKGQVLLPCHLVEPQVTAAAHSTRPGKSHGDGAGT